MWNSEEDERIPQKSFQKSLIKTRVYLFEFYFIVIS